jgi:hypothetical protein
MYTWSVYLPDLIEPLFGVVVPFLPNKLYGAVRFFRSGLNDLVGIDIT